MDIRKIGIIHLNQIGDLVFSLPLLKALQENDRGATIHSIVRPYLQELLNDSPYINKVISRKSGIRNTLTLLKEIRRNRYDLLISLSNSVKCLLLTTFSRARMKVGFSNFPWDLCLDIKERVEGHPSWHNNFKLLKRLNIDVKKKDYVGLVTLSPESKPGTIQGNYVVVSPGTSARRRIKAWGETKFADLVIRLKERYDLNPVLVGGKEDQEDVDQIIQSIKERDLGTKVNPISNLAGKIGLRDLCYLLRDAGLFVGVDSGIMHLASSFDIPVVGIFGPSDPFYVGPQNRRSVSVREELECVPCYFKGCETRECMTTLEVQKVFRACEQVLNS
jgi:heptosyltransferase-2